MSTILQRDNPQSAIDWLLLALLIFVPRLLQLNVFLTADEPLFLQHAQEFAAGLASGDFSQTLGIGYPGVTVAWWSAPAAALTGPPAAAGELAAFTAGRTATALATGLLLLLLYGLARLLLGRWPALLGVGLLALDPYTLAYSRLLHIATPLTLFMTLAGLACLLWLRDDRRRWLGLAGLFSGLALLTKSTALLLGPMLILSLLGWTAATGRWRDAVWWRNKIGGLLMMACITGAVFFALWPAMWIDPARALGLTFGKLFADQQAGAGNLGLFWLGRFVEDPGPAFYPVAFLLKSTPWLLVGLLLSFCSMIASCRLRIPFISGRPQTAAQTQSSAIVIALWLFALSYLILMTFASKKSIRYMLPAFPAFYLLAGIAFYQLALRWSEQRAAARTAGSASFQSSRWLPVLLFLLPVSLAALYHPYYFTYYNPLLLGWRWAPQTLLVGWGEGLDQAARYLNDRPPSTVSTWYEWLFPIFYEGQVEGVVPQENLITADHAVLYINQVQRDIPGPNIIHYFQTRRQPERTVRLAGIDYAWIYPGPVAGFRPDPAPQFPLGGNFGDEARLLGYDLQPRPRSGQPLVVTLYWRALATPPADRFVFVRLIDPAGRVWARTDSPPVMGLWPTGRWQTEMLIEDAHELPILAGTPPGLYRLEVGLYDPATGQPLPATGQPVGQGGGLLLGEVDLEWQPLQTEPDLARQTNTRLAPNARLIGYDPLAGSAATGDLLPVRLAWREAGSIFSSGAMPNNQVMFQWRPAQGPKNDPPLAQQLDELPWPVEKWGRRATLLSQHEVIVPPALATGRYDLFVRLHTGSDPAGSAFRLGPVEVTAPAHHFELPAAALSPEGAAQLAGQISLVGYDFQRVRLDESAQPRFDLRLYWRTSVPLTTRYKVFAQLLAADHNLAAQSDAFPAAGQRPTTGWLPEEIITDAHSLTLPPDLPGGNYSLIAGLYDPSTGQRLPLLDPAGQPVADAIFIAQVTLP